MTTPDESPQPDAPHRRPTDELSAQEAVVATLVAKGKQNKQIAEELGISPLTVASYLRRIFAKLQVTTRAEMVAKAMARGLIGGKS